MRPPSFSSRSIQPPGKSSSIRPPRSGQSAPPNHSLRLSRQPLAPWVCLLIIALAVVAGGVVHLRGSAGSHAASSSIPTTGTPTSNTAAPPVTDDPWTEQWRLETGAATAWKPGEGWGFLSNGNHIAVYDNNLKGATPIQIYRVVGGRRSADKNLGSSITGIHPMGNQQHVTLLLTRLYRPGDRREN